MINWWLICEEMRIMKLEFADLQLLDAIDRQGSFSGAAEKIHRTRSAVSQSIQKIEDQLKYKIFDRTQSKIQFTPEGRFLLERGRHILRQVEQLKTDINIIEGKYESEFSIAYDDVISTNAIFSLIKDFQSAIGSSISIFLHREVLNGTWDALVEKRAILSLGVSGEPPMGLSCNQQLLGETHFIFAISPNHPLAKLPEPLSLEDLAGTCSIVISDTSTQLEKRSSGSYPGQPIIKVPNMEAKIKAHVQGLGVGYLPKHRIENLLSEGLLIEKNAPLLKSKTYLKTAWRTDTNSKILAWFLEYLEDGKVRKKIFDLE